MKIHMHCPGPLTDGLDSPCRGESRWTQNLAKLLANDDHEIVVTGAGRPVWGSTKPIPNVTLHPESFGGELNKFGPFDLNIDPSWWLTKSPMVQAKKHLVLKWSLEDYTREKPLPENRYLCYPLSIRAEQFYQDNCVNKDRTFFLPLPLGPKMHEPNFNKNCLLWTCKDIDREQYLRDNARMVAEQVLYPLLKKNPDFKVVWLMLEILRRNGINIKTRPNDVAINHLVPYYNIRAVLEACKLVVAVNIPGSILDAAVLGVPTLEWEEGGFFNEIGSNFGVLIENNAGPDRVAEVVEKYLTDEEFYGNYVRAIQHQLRFNLDSISLRYFYNIINKIF